MLPDTVRTGNGRPMPSARRSSRRSTRRVRCGSVGICQRLASLLQPDLPGFKPKKGMTRSAGTGEAWESGKAFVIPDPH